mgnify:FL=1
MRVAVVITVWLVGLVAVAGCAPSHYEYGQAERYRERESRDYFQHEEQQARRRAQASKRAQAQARARAREANARQERTREVERAQAGTRSHAQPHSQSQASEKVEAKHQEPVAAAPIDRTPSAMTTPPPAATPASPDTASAAPAAKSKSTEGADEVAREESRKQIEDGYRLLRAGFVKKARERFEQAMSANAPDASLAQGRSMDPSYLKTVAFPDVIPDAEQARRMYRRAILLGNSEAKGDLERLEKALAAAAPAVLPPASPGTAEPPAGQQAPISPQ